MKPQRFKNPCPHCTYHGQVEAGGVVADVFCCTEHDEEGDFEDFGVIILVWGEGHDYDQQDTVSLATGFPPDEAGGPALHCIGELDDIPLRALWAEALLLIVQDARAYREQKTGDCP